MSVYLEMPNGKRVRVQAHNMGTFVGELGFYLDAPRTASVIADAFANDEIGAVWHVYREIARRIPRKAFTRHASTLGDALR